MTLAHQKEGTIIPGHVIITNLGRPIGSKGETAVKMAISEAGELITAYPIRAIP